MTRLKAFQIDTADLASDPSFDIATKLSWFGQWVDGTYDTNDVVRDGAWTMVATTTTTDRAAPQAIGDADTQPSVDTVWAENNSHTGVVQMRHKYVTTTPGWLQSLRIRAPFWDKDVFTKITFVNNTTGAVNIINNPILTDDDWTTIRIDNVPYASGADFEIWYEYYNSDELAAINGGWTSNVGTGIPTSQQFNIDNLATPTVIEVSHTDLDSDNRSTELDGVIVGSIININETGDTKRNVEVEVSAIDTTSVTSTKYTVTLIQNGNDDIRDDRTCTIAIDIPITQASIFNYNTDYWLSNPPDWATVSSELYFDGVIQADTNDAYGIEVIFQEASVSTDWEMLAYSSIGGATAASTLNDLTDVETSGVSDGQVLTYSGSPLIWIPETPITPAVALNDLTDVDTSGLTDGQVLTYSGSPAIWIPETPITQAITPAIGVIVFFTNGVNPVTVSALRGIALAANTGGTSWTVVRTGVGQYRVTHDIGHNNFSCLAAIQYFHVMLAENIITHVHGITSTVFDVRTVSAATGALLDPPQTFPDIVVTVFL